MKRLRILIVAASLPSWGGIEKHVSELAPALITRGHDAAIACQPRSEIERRAQEAGVPIVHLVLNSPFDWKKLRAFVQAMRGRYDVVHTHHPGDYLVPATAARIARVPLVVQSMHVPPHLLSLRSRVAHRALYDGAIAVSEFIARDFGTHRVAPKAIFVARNGLNLGSWKSERGEAIRNELSIPATAFLVVAAGRIVPEKGFEFLVRAIHLSRRLGVDAYCAIAGVSDSPRLEDLIDSLELHTVVQFLQRRRDVPDLFSAADAVAVPSTWSEPFGYTALEGLASGRPVIASCVGGIPEIVTPDVGYLLPPGDVEAIAGAIVDLASNSEKRVAMGQAARRRAGEFTLDECVRKLELAYDSLLDGQRK